MESSTANANTEILVKTRMQKERDRNWIGRLTCALQVIIIGRDWRDRLLLATLISRTPKGNLQPRIVDLSKRKESQTT